jgi:hypothetical protein
MAKEVDFHLYKLQLRDEATLFPSSVGISDVAVFVRDVLRWSMEQKRKVPRRWVVAELELDEAIESTLFYGQLVRLKKTRTIHFEAENLRLEPALTDDADTLAFVLDGRNEYFLLQFSTQIPDETALKHFRSFFNMADPTVRQSKIIYFDAIKSSEEAIERLRSHKIRKFIANLKTPNGEINRAFEKLLKPVSENTQADAVILSWESKTGHLNVGEGSAIDEALTLTTEYGSWKAIPYEKHVTPIVSDEVPLAIKMPTTTATGLFGPARRFFDDLRNRLGVSRVGDE